MQRGCRESRLSTDVTDTVVLYELMRAMLMVYLPTLSDSKKRIALWLILALLAGIWTKSKFEKIHLEIFDNTFLHRITLAPVLIRFTNNISYIHLIRKMSFIFVKYFS